jgi:hypothetical protein
MTATTESRADMTRPSRHRDDGPTLRVRALARCLVTVGLSIAFPVLVIGCDDDPGHDPPPDASVPDASAPDATPPDAPSPDAQSDAQPPDAQPDTPNDAQPSDGGPGDDPGDGVPPRVVASTPEPGAECVATETEILVTFDEDIDSSTVHQASFSVVDDRENPVLGTLVVEGALVTFRPAIELTFRERYTVTITTEVTDLAGTRLAEEWSGSFTMIDGTFTDSTLLDLSDSNPLSRPAVAVSDRGHGFGLSASPSAVRATHFVPPGGSPTVTGVPSAGASEIDVAAGPLDTALAVWRDGDGIRATRHAPPEGWHREAVLLADSGSSPQAAVDARGDGLAVWLQRDDTHVGVFASRFQGTGWSAASRVDSDAGDAASLQLAVDHAGHGVAVWAQGGDIWSAAFRDGGWEPAALLEEAPGAAHQPLLVLDGDGRGMAFWIQHDGTQYRLCWSRLNPNGPNGGWSPPVFADGGPGVGAGGQWLTWFAFNSLGQAVALWDDYLDDCDPESPRPDPCALVYAARFDVDSGWQAAEAVSPDHYENIVTSRVAGIDRHGSMFAAWTHAAPEIGNPGAWLRRYTPEQGWGEIENLALEAGGDFTGLAIAVSPQGRMFLAWHEQHSLDEIVGKAFY